MFRRFIASFVCLTFIVSTCPLVFAQEFRVSDLPVPGTMVSVSPSFEPALLKGLTVHKDNPFLFDFIVDPGQDKSVNPASSTVIPTKAGIQYQEQLRNQADRMIKYFFAALTIPDKDIWVNLSPYEKDRMVPVSLGQTAMGRDLLAQDYLLKQLTASLIYPQKALGKTFWDTVYSKAKAMYGTTQIPVNTFNKVWIVPQRVGIYEHNQTAFIVNGHLKVMLEEDYLATTKHNAIDTGVIARTLSEAKGTKQSFNKVNALGSQIIRQIILPEIEKEVNEGKNFATLRQIFYAQALAVWFKRNLKQALLNRVYANKGTVKGIDNNDAATNEAIYRQYLQAYKKGVFNYIKEDIDPVTQETLPRKYFSGGYSGKDISEAMVAVQLSPMAAGDNAQAANLIDVQAVAEVNPEDAAVLATNADREMARPQAPNAAMISLELAIRVGDKGEGIKRFPLSEALRYLDIALQILPSNKQVMGNANAVVVVPNDHPLYKGIQIARYREFMQLILGEAKQEGINVTASPTGSPNAEGILQKDQLPKLADFLMQLKMRISHVQPDKQKVLQEISNLAHNVRTSKDEVSKKSLDKINVLLKQNPEIAQFIQSIEQMLVSIRGELFGLNPHGNQFAYLLGIDPENRDFRKLWSEYGNIRLGFFRDRDRIVPEERNYENDGIKRYSAYFAVLSKRYDLAMAGKDNIEIVPSDAAMAIDYGKRLLREILEAHLPASQQALDELKGIQDIYELATFAGSVENIYEGVAAIHEGLEIIIEQVSRGVGDAAMFTVSMYSVLRQAGLNDRQIKLFLNGINRIHRKTFTDIGLPIGSREDTAKYKEYFDKEVDVQLMQNPRFKPAIQLLRERFPRFPLHQTPTSTFFEEEMDDLRAVMLTDSKFVEILSEKEGKFEQSDPEHLAIHLGDEKIVPEDLELLNTLIDEPRLNSLYDRFELGVTTVEFKEGILSIHSKLNARYPTLNYQPSNNLMVKSQFSCKFDYLRA